MNSRTLIAAAVASACAWPLASVARDMHSPHASSAASFSPIVTPHSVDESAPWLTAEETRARHTRAATYTSLPNPQSPWSPNESGPVNYAEEMRERAQHVAAVEQTRVAVIRENERIARVERERLAQIEAERIEAERLAAASSAPAPEAGTVIATAPVGSTAGASSPVVAVPETSSTPPSEPRQDSPQPDRTAVLVDTRSSGSTIAAITPEPADPADRSASEPGRDAAPVGATRSEGASGGISTNAYVTLHDSAAAAGTR